MTDTCNHKILLACGDEIMANDWMPWVNTVGEVLALLKSMGDLQLTSVGTCFHPEF